MALLILHQNKDRGGTGAFCLWFPTGIISGTPKLVAWGFEPLVLVEGK